MVSCAGVSGCPSMSPRVVGSLWVPIGCICPLVVLVVEYSAVVVDSPPVSSESW